MTTNAKSDDSSPPVGIAGDASSVSAAVVDPSDEGAPAYAMFDVSSISADGAFLTGQLFFEIDEEFNLEISPGNGTRLRIRARVVALERGDAPGMKVQFRDIPDADRKILDNLTKS